MTSRELLTIIRKNLKDVGIRRGDIVYVASDITKLIYLLRCRCGINYKEIDIFLNDFVDLLQESVGEEGTLLFPMFTWEFCRCNAYNYNSTKCEVGALNNWIFENRCDFVRTKHAIYSFMVWGANSDCLYKMDNQEAWSATSPFSFLKNYNGKQLFWDIEAYQGMTFVHYVEQCLDVPYRYPKYFFGDYVDENNCVEKRCYSMYVREVGVEQEVCVTNEFLINNHVASKVVFEEISLTLCDLGLSYGLITEDIKNNGGKQTLSFENYEFNLNNKKKMSYDIAGL